MIEVSFEQLHGWLVAFLWPFTRISAFVIASPLWGHSSVPNRVKLGLTALITILVGAQLPPLPDVPVYSWAGVGIMVEQILIGASMGMVIRVMLTAVQAAGEFIGLQMGLAFATFISPDTGANTMILSRIFYIITIMMFLAVNGHLIAIETLITSFTILPVGTLGLNSGAFEMLVRFGGTIFIGAMILALPLIAVLLIINLSLGILNRSAPQLTVFSVGFPTSLTIGLVLLVILMTDLGRFLHAWFSQGLEVLAALVVELAA